jgi:hypothetical protein
MGREEKKRQVIEDYLATRRRIRDIEKEALAKVGAIAADASTCSFCGQAREPLSLVKGDGVARICFECIRQIGGLLDDENGK